MAEEYILQSSEDYTGVAELMGHLHRCDLQGRSHAAVALVGFWDHEGVVSAGQAPLDNFPRGCQGKAGWPERYYVEGSQRSSETQIRSTYFKDRRQAH